MLARAHKAATVDAGACSNRDTHLSPGCRVVDRGSRAKERWDERDPISYNSVNDRCLSKPIVWAELFAALAEVTRSERPDDVFSTSDQEASC